MPNLVLHITHTSTCSRCCRVMHFTGVGHFGVEGTANAGAISFDKLLSFGPDWRSRLQGIGIHWICWRITLDIQNLDEWKMGRKCYQAPPRIKHHDPFSASMSDKIMCQKSTFTVLYFNILQFHYFNLVVPLAIFHRRGIIFNFILTLFFCNAWRFEVYIQVCIKKRCISSFTYLSLMEDF